MTLEIGSTLIDRYQIGEVISQGGMGAIYKAVDQSLGVIVAVKENSFTTDQSSRQFKKEASLLATLRHPNLPRVTDHFIVPDTGQYLVMDFIQGEDLLERMGRHGRISEKEAILIGAAICDALTYLHSRSIPIIHRDVKPGNIKITSNGDIYLVDFGLAKMDEPGQITTVGAQALTPGYAPPEQYGQGTEPRSDIYSLGATLYAALTGHVPEDGMARANNGVQLTPVKVHNPEISSDMVRVIEKAMSVSPNDRYPNAEIFKEALLNTNPRVKEETKTMTHIRVFSTPEGSPQTASSQPSGAPPISAPPGMIRPPVYAGQQSPSAPIPVPGTPISKPQTRPPTTRSRRSWLWILLGLGFLGILGICAVGAIFAFSSGQPISLLSSFSTATNDTRVVATEVVIAPGIAQTPSLEAIPTEVTEITLEPTATSTPSATPTGGGQGLILFASDRTGNPQIFSMSQDGTGLEQVTEIAAGACQPSWAPDGLRFAFTSPCAKRQAAYPGSGIFIADADGGNITPLASAPGGDYDPDWSPDGNTIAFTSVRDNIPHIYTYDLSTNQATLLSSPSSNDSRPAWSPDGTLIAFQTTRIGSEQIWIMGADGSSAREFSRKDDGVAFQPSWSNNQESLIYLHSYDLPWVASRRYNVPGAKEIRISQLQPVGSPKFSPDDNWLVMEIRQDNNWDIYRMLSNGAQVIRLTDDTAIDFHPDWQP